MDLKVTQVRGRTPVLAPIDLGPDLRPQGHAAVRGELGFPLYYFRRARGQVQRSIRGSYVFSPFQSNSGIVFTFSLKTSQPLNIMFLTSKAPAQGMI